MLVLDLQTVRCPLALITLKKKLLTLSNERNFSLTLLFSIESTMSDIKLYLDKKAYLYRVVNDKNQLSLVITGHCPKGKKTC